MVRVQWSRKAVKQMQKIAESDRQTIYVKAKELRNFPNIGNIKHLKNHKYEYRLRIGNYRILFNFAWNTPRFAFSMRRLLVTVGSTSI